MDSTDKASLRLLFRNKRNLLSTTEQQELDNSILQQFRNIRLPSVLHYALGFIPIHRFREPNVLLLTRELQVRYPGLQLALPRVRKDSTDMDALAVTPDTSFIPGSWGIDEPDTDHILEPKVLDIIFIPLLAFDEKGYRVGYGKGVYDMFLKRCRQDTLKIGVSHFEPVPEISDSYTGDIPLNLCITPHRTYAFDREPSL